MEKMEANWDEVGDGEHYFSPEYDRSYRVVISSVSLYKRKFEEEEDPKLRVACVLKTIDDEPSGKIWDTGSLPVLRKLKKYVGEGGKWNCTSTFLLKKKKDGLKTTYVFEELP